MGTYLENFISQISPTVHRTEDLLIHHLQRNRLTTDVLQFTSFKIYEISSRSYFFIPGIIARLSFDKKYSTKEWCSSFL